MQKLEMQPPREGREVATDCAEAMQHTWRWCKTIPEAMAVASSQPAFLRLCELARSRGLLWIQGTKAVLRHVPANRRVADGIAS